MALSDQLNAVPPTTKCSDGKGSLLIVRNVTRDTVIADHVEVAGTNTKRSKGLLGRKSLPKGQGMWIVPCEAIHTFFMQFPIDLIYLDKKLRVRKIRSSVKAWRISACLSAHSILELPAGTIQETQTQPGDVLDIQEPSVRDSKIEDAARL